MLCINGFLVYNYNWLSPISMPFRSLLLKNSWSSFGNRENNIGERFSPYITYKIVRRLTIYPYTITKLKRNIHIFYYLETFTANIIWNKFWLKTWAPDRIKCSYKGTPLHSVSKSYWVSVDHIKLKRAYYQVRDMCWKFQ